MVDWIKNIKLICRTNDGTVLLACSLDGQVGFIDLSKYFSRYALEPLKKEDEEEEYNLE